MAKKKKINRKKLLKEPDEFLSLTSQMLRWAAEHKTRLYYALAIIVVLALTIASWRFYINRAENTAMALMQQAVAKYETVKGDSSPGKAYRDVSGDFEFILNNYGRRPSGKLARIFYANVCFDTGRYKKAIALYRQALEDFEKHPLVHNLVLSDLGYAYEQIDDDRAAVSYFEKITTGTYPILQAEALFNLGVLYEKLGEAQKSKAAYQKILAGYPDSIYFKIVKQRLTG